MKASILLALLLVGCETPHKFLGIQQTPVPTPPLTAQPQPPTASKPIYHIFVTDGQSNMYGSHQGGLFQPNDHVYGRLEGPGFQTAVDYAQAHPGSYAKTINCAENGSSISVHLEGRIDFETCIQNIAEQMAPGDVLEAVLWWQGEADASAGMSGADWSNAFRTYVDALRRRLGKPNLPVVFVQLGILVSPYNGVTYTAPTWDDLKQAQASFFMPHTGMVKSEDLTLADYVHYDTASNSTVGHRMFNMFQGI